MIFAKREEKKASKHVITFKCMGYSQYTYFMVVLESNLSNL